MEYVEKQIEIEMSERKAREDLYAFKRQYGYAPGGDGGGGVGGRGGECERRVSCCRRVGGGC